MCRWAPFRMPPSPGHGGALDRFDFKLIGQKAYARTGVLSLEYAVQHGNRPKRRG